MTQLLALALCASPALVAIYVAIGRSDGPASLRAVSFAVWLTAAGYAVANAADVARSSMPVDAIGISLSALTLFIAAIVLQFSKQHMRADRDLRGYAVQVGLLVSAVLVTINAQHFALFAAGWIASGWLLADAIGHVKGWQQAADAKLRARRIFVASDAALVAGFVLLWAGLDVTRFDQLGSVIASGSWLIAPLSLILFAALARCAVPPFHKWLMGSMTAPTPISALMHAGLVNAGGLLLLRVAPALETAPEIKTAAVVIGAAGALFGTGVMIVRPDVKRALGGSTVAQMSFMIMTCGLGAYAAALWHLIAHGLFKSWAFLGAASNIGRAPPPALKPWSPLAAAISAVVAGSVAIATAAAGGVVLHVPTALAIVSALASFAALTRAHGARLGAVAAMAVTLTATYLAGLAVVEALPGLPEGAAPFAWPGQAILIATFISAWVWQSTRLPLPPALYARMLNTGGPALLR